jgi:hypothetical protein
MVLNLKFPIVRNKPPLQRNSFYTLSSLNGPPPGFGNNPSHFKNPSALGFMNKRASMEPCERGFSPPGSQLIPPMPKKKPTSKRSCQNIIQPLVPENEMYPGFGFEQYLKDKKTSDSISDNRDDQFLIKEEDDDDSLEEKKADEKPS